ncbi:MAG: 30S ribosomal protein S17e [Candidatus Bathyarchaeota archaeon]|nr:30S ribosomal protein S17e [Candidatus Bathyarchaeota archaeon]
MKANLGKVRPENVKKVSRELVERYPDKFSKDFQANKKTLDSLIQVYSPKLKNRIAGYITRLSAIAQRRVDEEREEEDGTEEGVDEEDEEKEE